MRQQLESFNEFVENTMQEIVDERGSLIMDQHAQYTGAAGDESVCKLPQKKEPGEEGLMNSVDTRSSLVRFIWRRRL